MPRLLNNIDTQPKLFAQEAAASAQCQLFHLITVANIPNEAPLFLVDSNYDITYSSIIEGVPTPITYQKFPLKFSGVSISTDGSIDKASITVSNVSRVLMQYVEDYDGLAGCTVSVITVYEKFLDFIYTLDLDGTLSVNSNPMKDYKACIRDEYEIDSYIANEQTIAFQLNAVVDFNIKVPRRRFTPFSCYWHYKDVTTCQYDGPLPLCAKSLDDCYKHINLSGVDNSSRFGGFPGIPSDTRMLRL